MFIYVWNSELPKCETNINENVEKCTREEENYVQKRKNTLDNITLKFYYSYRLSN